MLDIVVDSLAIGEKAHAGQLLEAVLLFQLVQDFVRLPLLRLTDFLKDGIHDLGELALIAILVPFQALQMPEHHPLGNVALEVVVQLIVQLVPCEVGEMVVRAGQLRNEVVIIQNIDAGVRVVAAGYNDCKGGKLVLIIGKAVGRITAVVVKVSPDFGVVAYFVVIIRNEDASALKGKIRGAHILVFFGVILYYMQKPCQTGELG